MSSLITGTGAGAERAIFACSPFLLTALMTGVSDSGTWGVRGSGNEELSCTNISISFFCLYGPEDVTQRPSGTITTWVLEVEHDVSAAFNQKYG